MNEEEFGLYYDSELLTADKFAIIIEKRVAACDGSYITEVAELFEELDLDADKNKHLINKTLMERLYNEASVTNRLKEKHTSSKLPF